ncbi:hypothetical protein Bbelb_327690 [Branchiostoma belcheri]|nr:hypothetical protein Bbelb_327690 [Branchiostoma belcheri]
MEMVADPVTSLGKRFHSREQNQRRSLPEAWPIAVYPDEPENIYIVRSEHQTAINLPVSDRPPLVELRQFSVRDGCDWIHVYRLFVRESDGQRRLLKEFYIEANAGELAETGRRGARASTWPVYIGRFSEGTRHEIVETMYRMFVPRNYPEEDNIPGAVLVPMIPYEDRESHEKVTVISTLSFNSLDRLQTVFVAPLDSKGWVDITRTRACHKNALIPVDGPEVQKREAIRDIQGFFLQGISPTKLVVQQFGDILVNREIDDQVLLQELRDLLTTSGQRRGGTAVPTENTPLQNAVRTDDAILEHEGHLSQQGQQASHATGDGNIHQEADGDEPVLPRAVEQDLSALGVLRHFNREKATFGNHVKLCPLCRSKAGRLFHASTCRVSNCQRCNSVALEVARHMGRCDDPSCPIFEMICFHGLGILLFVPGSSEPTVAFVSLVRLVLAQILHLDA